jgi:tRNA(Arg) A34 adenosine deaminase TadA
MKHITLMNMALQQAKAAKDLGEIPVGAILVDTKGKVIAQGHNLTIANHDPTAHAEINVIREACKKLKTERLKDFSIYVTLEPCPMCAASISFAHIKQVYYGAYDPKGGGIDHGPYLYNQETCLHKPDVSAGILEEECSQLLKDFFIKKRP